MKMVIREMSADDLPFVINSWIRSWGGDTATAHIAGLAPRSRGCAVSAVTKIHRPLVAAVLAAAPLRLVTVPESDPGIICGWIVMSRRPDDVPIVQYAYVKYALRRCGIAGDLYRAGLAALGYGEVPPTVAVSHKGLGWDGLSAAHPELVWDPYSACPMGWAGSDDKERGRK